MRRLASDNVAAPPLSDRQPAECCARLVAHRRRRAARAARLLAPQPGLPVGDAKLADGLALDLGPAAWQHGADKAAEASAKIGGDPGSINLLQLFPDESRLIAAGSAASTRNATVYQPDASTVGVLEGHEADVVAVGTASTSSLATRPAAFAYGMQKRSPPPPTVEAPEAPLTPHQAPFSLVPTLEPSMASAKRPAEGANHLRATPTPALCTAPPSAPRASRESMASSASASAKRPKTTGVAVGVAFGGSYRLRDESRELDDARTLHRQACAPGSAFRAAALAVGQGQPGPLRRVYLRRRFAGRADA